MFITSCNQNKAEVAVLISDKADFRSKKIIRDKGGHYIIKEFIFQEDTQT